MSIYAPHPWDTLPAEPPRPGLPYDDVVSPLPLDEAVRFAEKWQQIEELREEAQELEDRADDLEAEAKKLEDALVGVPGLADAIGDDPYHFATTAEVREWCETKGKATA